MFAAEIVKEIKILSFGYLVAALVSGGAPRQPAYIFVRGGGGGFCRIAQEMGNIRGCVSEFDLLRHGKAGNLDLYVRSDFVLLRSLTGHHVNVEICYLV